MLSVVQAASVTNLTTALEGVNDPDDAKEFNGDIIKKLHVAEKHIRKNKLKVRTCDSSRQEAVPLVWARIYLLEEVRAGDLCRSARRGKPHRRRSGQQK